jgi:hypothetical protein
MEGIDINQFALAHFAGCCNPICILIRAWLMEVGMTTDLSDLLPTAKDMNKTLELAKLKKAEEELRRQEATEEEKRALVEHLGKASGVSDEEGVKRGLAIIRRAVNAGLTEVEVYRFPNQLCTDRGRAINQMEKGWESTLTGVPAEIHQLWKKYFQPRGYRLNVQVVDFPGGMPGDIGMFLGWD